MTSRLLERNKAVMTNYSHKDDISKVQVNSNPPPNDWEKPSNPWVGVDLDGTLAHYGDKAHPWNMFGEPIKPMIDRIKNWRAQGIAVKIVTARAFPFVDGAANSSYILNAVQQCLVTGEAFTLAEMIEVIKAWCQVHVGERLPVTCAKDYRMMELWDDRAIQVVANTGRSLHEEHEAVVEALRGKVFNGTS